jgi:putative DNA primase/helicase
VLTWLLGDYAANAAFDTFDAGRRSDNSNDLAALKGKRLVTVIETEEDRRLAEARVKSVTGGDQVTARFLYGEFFSYKPQFKIWLAMNHRPIIRGTDRGIWRRIQLIPFTQSFEGREDKDLGMTLQKELPGILNWAMEGLRAWLGEGLGTSKAVQKATKEYQEESDQVGRWLLDSCNTGDRYSATAKDAYSDYIAWCEGAGERSLSQSLWGRRLTERGFQRTRNKRKWSWLGFALVEERAKGGGSLQKVIPMIPMIPILRNFLKVKSSWEILRNRDHRDHRDHPSAINRPPLARLLGFR